MNKGWKPIMRILYSMFDRNQLGIRLLDTIKLNNILIMFITEFKQLVHRSLLNPNHPLIENSRIMLSLIGGMLIPNINQLKTIIKLKKDI